MLPIAIVVFVLLYWGFSDNVEGKIRNREKREQAFEWLHNLKVETPADA